MLSESIAVFIQLSTPDNFSTNFSEWLCPLKRKYMAMAKIKLRVLWWLMLIVYLMEFNIIRNVSLWACLWNRPAQIASGAWKGQGNGSPPSHREKFSAADPLLLAKWILFNTSNLGKKWNNKFIFPYVTICNSVLQKTKTLPLLHFPHPNIFWNQKLYLHLLQYLI